MIANRRPDARLPLDAGTVAAGTPARAFFRRDTEGVARALIGMHIARRWRGRWYGARIVETEAYLGVEDRAAHSWGGRRTDRVAPMYADGGHLYVFFVYGMHHCANVVTRRAGVPEAVLLRAAEGPAGAPPRLLSGPGPALRRARHHPRGHRSRSSRRGPGDPVPAHGAEAADRRFPAHRRGLRGRR